MAGLIPKFQVLRHKAQTILPWPVFDYIDGGADDEITLIRNREAWRNIRMVPRVMRNIQKVDTSCVLYGSLNGFERRCFAKLNRRTFGSTVDDCSYGLTWECS